MELLVADVQDDPTLLIGQVHDEEDFADKFPFKEQREAEEADRRRREEEEAKRAAQVSMVP